MIYLTSADYRSTRWSGGTTTQLFIFPPSASYAKRDFLYRISSATVELEQSEFTDLPDYDRWITTLNGNISLAHDSGQTVHLTPYDVYSFDGGCKTLSIGRCTDFNLMLRKGKARGAIRAIRLPHGGTLKTTFESPLSEAFPVNTMLIFCGSGEGKLVDGEETVLLKQGECSLIENAHTVSLYLAAAAPSDFIVAEIQH